MLIEMFIHFLMLLEIDNNNFFVPSNIDVVNDRITKFLLSLLMNNM
jgi:hypothetical protein